MKTQFSMKKAIAFRLVRPWGRVVRWGRGGAHPRNYGTFPHQLAEGMTRVLVNGQFALRDRHAGALGGRVLSRKDPMGAASR